MIIKYSKRRKWIGNDSVDDKLVIGKKYIVYGYEKAHNKEDIFWVIDEDNSWSLCDINSVEILDYSYSKYWVKLSSQKYNTDFFYPIPWTQWFNYKMLSSEYDKIDFIDDFWSYRVERVGYFTNTYFDQKGQYIIDINTENPDFFYECNKEKLKYTAKYIEDNWVFCAIKECNEVFEVERKHCIIVCPKCSNREYNPIYVCPVPPSCAKKA